MRDHPAFKALYSDVYVEFCLVRLASLGSNRQYFWSKCSWLQLYRYLHLSGLMSVFVLGHFNNKQKSILKMFIDVIIEEGKSIMSRFYINLSYIFLVEWRLLLASLLTRSIISLFVRCSSDLSPHSVSAVSVSASQAQMLQHPQFTYKPGEMIRLMMHLVKYPVSNNCQYQMLQKKK